MGCDWKCRDHMISMLRQSCYNADEVIKREDRNWELFEKYPELNCPAATSQV